MSRRRDPEALHGRRCQSVAWPRPSLFTDPIGTRMTQRSSPFSSGVAIVGAMALLGVFLVGPPGAAQAAGPARGQVAQGGATPAAATSDGWYRFGPAGAAAKRDDVVADGVTLVTLSNGVTVALKPTKLVADEVLVNVAVAGGHQSLAPDSRAAAELAESMFLQAGVGLKTQEQLVATFGPVVSSIEFDIWSPWFNLGGKGRSGELRPLLEILTAYVSDPGWRLDDLEAAKAAAIESGAVLRSNATIVLQTQSRGVLSSDDPRYVRPTEAQVRAVDKRAVRRSIDAAFRSGDIDVTVVGDFDLETTLSMVAETFGSLAARPGAAPPTAAYGFPPHTAKPIEILFRGDPEQQGRQVAWPAPDVQRRSKEEEVISAMLGVMIFRLRESPVYQKAGFRKGLKSDVGYLAISAVGAPDMLATFDADVAKVARDIASRGVTQAEIDRAQAVGISDEGLMRAAAPNLYWIIVMMELRGDRKKWEEIKASLTFAQEVTPEEVQRAAARYLRADESVSIVANPEAGPESR